MKYKFLGIVSDADAKNLEVLRITCNTGSGKKELEKIVLLSGADNFLVPGLIGIS